MIEAIFGAYQLVDAANAGIQVYDRWKVVDDQRRAVEEQRLRQQNRAMVGLGVGVGLLGLGAAAADYLAANRAQPRLARSYFLGYCDSTGRSRLGDHWRQVGVVQREVEARRSARARRLKSSAWLAVIGAAAALVGLAVQIIAAVLVGGVLLVLGAFLLARAVPRVADPVFPPDPVVFPSAPRKSAATAMLRDADRTRAALDAITERLAARDPLACCLLVEAKRAAELNVEEAAVSHETLRWFTVDSGLPPEESQDCADAAERLRVAVAQYADLVPLAERACGTGGGAAMEALAKRAGLEALLPGNR